MSSDTMLTGNQWCCPVWAHFNQVTVTPFRIERLLSTDWSHLWRSYWSIWQERALGSSTLEQAWKQINILFSGKHSSSHRNPASVVSGLRLFSTLPRLSHLMAQQYFVSLCSISFYSKSARKCELMFSLWWSWLFYLHHQQHGYFLTLTLPVKF